jgi:hypothetical protein
MLPKSKKSKRWVKIVPESACNPKGSVEHLRQAVEALGPFIHNTREEAELSGRGRIPSEMRVSNELAVQQVAGLAFDYNGHRHQIANAPRTKQVVEQISEFERLSGELARCWKSMDDLTRYYFDTAGTGIVDCPAIPGLKDGAAEHSQPSQAGAGAEVHDETAELLDAISCYATLSLRNFLVRRGIADIDQADKGGNTNLIREMAGTPDWGLVSGAWHIYERFKPGQATGTEWGPFHCFCLKIFELATGQDPAGSKLHPSIKRMVAPRREYMELVHRDRILADELDALEGEDRRYRNEERADEILKERLLIHGQRIQATCFEPPKRAARPGKVPRT